jgi:hypothetical protein
MKSLQKRAKLPGTGTDQLEIQSKVDFVSPRWLKVVIKILPLIILAYALIMYILSSSSSPETENRLDEFQISGFIAYAAIFFLAQILFTKASVLILQLWKRNIFHYDAKVHLNQFSKHLENLANHNLWQIIFILLALVIALAGSFNSCKAQNTVGLELLFCNYHKGAIRTSKSVFETIIEVCMALVIWRILITAWTIRELGSKFDLKPNWHHPDKSGGLLPIGTTSFWIASIFAVPAIYIGAWLILCGDQRIEVCSHMIRLNSRLLFFKELLLVIFVASLISFVWPLWATHQVMVKKRDQVQHDELIVVGQKINEVSQQIIENVDKIPQRNQSGQKALDENLILQKKLDALQKTYLDLERLPVWPFNKDTILQLISTQGIPLLGLTGIGSKTLDLLQIVFGQK